MLTLRAIEYVLLFVLLPLALFAVPFRINPIPLLIGAVGVVLYLLFRDPTFDRSTLFAFPNPARNVGRVLMLVPLIGGAMAIVLHWLAPQAMFNLPGQRPGLWVLVMCFYQLISVVPQTLIYRVFFMHRYKILFGQGWGMVIVAAIAFGMCHVIFKHPFPVIATTLGGVLFAWRYATTRSAPLSALEHAIYGDLAFTLGYGFYLYHGSLRTLGG